MVHITVIDILMIELWIYSFILNGNNENTLVGFWNYRLMWKLAMASMVLQVYLQDTQKNPTSPLS